MTLLVDTSVWSLALRKDGTTIAPEARTLQEAIAGSARSEHIAQQTPAWATSVGREATKGTH